MKFKITLFKNFKDMGPEMLKNLTSFHKEIFGIPYTEELLTVLPKRINVSIFVAQDKNGILGFKSGCELSPTKYYSWSGAVQPGARNKGVGAALMQEQHKWCASNGYKTIQTKTKNKWKDMIVLNLRSGFDIIGSYTDEKGEPKLILEKKI